MPDPIIGTNPTNNLTAGQGLGVDISGILSLIASLNGTDARNANDVANVADPFRNERPAYQDQMRAFMADPGSIFKDPAFVRAQEVGGEAVARNAGAAGMGNSGNKLASLFNFGQSSALDFEKMKFGELLPLTGATTGNPGAAALATQLGQQNKQNGLSAGIAGIAGLLTQMGIPGAIAKQIGDALGGGGGFGDINFANSGVTGDIGLDTGGAGGALMDWNAGNTSVGDQNIINDIFGGAGGMPDLTELFGGL